MDANEHPACCPDAPVTFFGPITGAPTCCENLSAESLRVDYKDVTYEFLWDAAVNGWRGWLLGEPLVIRFDPTGSGARPGDTAAGPFLISPDPSPGP